MGSDELAGTGVAGRKGPAPPSEQGDTRKEIKGFLAAWLSVGNSSSDSNRLAEWCAQPGPVQKALASGPPGQAEEGGGLSRPCLSLRQRDLGDTTPLCVTCTTGSLLTASPAVRCADGGARATCGGLPAAASFSERQSRRVISGKSSKARLCSFET